MTTVHCRLTINCTSNAHSTARRRRLRNRAKGKGNARLSQALDICPVGCWNELLGMFVQWSRSRSRCPSVEEWALHHAGGQTGSNCTLVLPLLLIRAVTDEALFRQIFCCYDSAFCPRSLAEQKKKKVIKRKKENMSTASSRFLDCLFNGHKGAEWEALWRHWWRCSEEGNNRNQELLKTREDRDPNLTKTLCIKENK